MERCPGNIFKKEMQGVAYVYNDIFGVSGKRRLYVYIYANITIFA